VVTGISNRQNRGQIDSQKNRGHLQCKYFIIDA
jgi:hypothetical protein